MDYQLLAQEFAVLFQNSSAYGCLLMGLSCYKRDSHFQNSILFLTLLEHCIVISLIFLGFAKPGQFSFWQFSFISIMGLSLLMYGVITYPEPFNRRCLYLVIVYLAMSSTLPLFPDSLKTLTTHESKRYDLLLFNLDKSLGFSPSQWVRNLYLTLPKILRSLTLIVYFSLPTYLLVMFAYCYKFHLRLPFKLMFETAIATSIASIIYIFLPACGPVYVANFLAEPFNTALLIHGCNCIANAMPSMHAGIALLIWLNCRSLSKNMAHFGLFVFAGTLFATLALGEHYVIDLLLGIILSFAVHCFVEHRKLSALNFSMLVGWLMLIKYQYPFLLLRPHITFALYMFTGLFIVWSLAKRFQEII